MTNPIQVIESTLSPKEKALIKKQLKESARPARHPSGTIPPYVLLPLLPYLPKEWVVWENSGQGLLAEGLRKLNGNLVLETRNNPGMAFDAIVSAPRIYHAPLQAAYETLKPFALLLPLELLTSEFQRSFQQKGLMLIVPDRRICYNASGQPMAWFCWSLPNVYSAITYAHIPGDEHLQSWMVWPTSRAAIRKG